MNAIVLPFPRSRDRRFVRRHAKHMAMASTATKAKTHLQRQVQIQRETLERRGVAPDVIEAEARALERNIRAECWGLLVAPGGAA